MTLVFYRRHILVFKFMSGMLLLYSANSLVFIVMFDTTIGSYGCIARDHPRQTFAVGTLQ